MAAQQWTNRLSLAFAAGSLGGLANSLIVWGAGKAGLTAALGVSIVPQFTPDWLYPRLVWGGLWGFLFLLPWPGRNFLPWFRRNRALFRGLTYSLLPSAVQLFYVFPIRADHGMLGVSLGALTPLLVLAFNAVWGVVAVWWWQKGQSAVRKRWLR